VSARNKESVERALITQLKNSLLIQNPLKAGLEDCINFPLNSCVMFACVARLDTQYKGQDVLLKVLSSTKWLNRDWKLSLFGTGKDQNFLYRLIKLYGLEDKVLICGFATDLNELWRNHHMLILPSLSEGTPLALIEASYCGRPAIVTDVGGNTELTIDCETGFVAAACSEKYLDEALEKAWLSQASWKKLGENANRRVKEYIKAYDYSQLLDYIHLT
jgi:glycosyltransferase involved in cell wall biosynthesis